MAGDAVRHHKQLWGYPISLDAIGLIYNKKLVNGAPPTQIGDFIPFHRKLKSEHPEMNSILWDYSSPYYSWGILASSGGYIFEKQTLDTIFATAESRRWGTCRGYLRRSPWCIALCDS